MKSALLIRAFQSYKSRPVFIFKFYSNHYKMKEYTNIKKNTCNLSSCDGDQIRNFHQSANNKLMSDTDQPDLYIIELLKKLIELKDKNVSSWVIEVQMKELCRAYKELTSAERLKFFETLTTQYAVNHSSVCKIANLISKNEESRHLMKYEEKLRNALMPEYRWLLTHIGKLENGIKFLVDMRTDIMDTAIEMDSMSSNFIHLHQLNLTIRDLLSLWFSVGFLSVKRITWKSSCEMLQKISEYEAVHPIRNWTDLKQRVGPYRRCFVYTHSTMPGEPLVVLHTALTDEIASSVAAIMSNVRRLSQSSDEIPKENLINVNEDPSKITAVVFYSIASTQRGLHGIELGNYLIKQVIKELLSEFPQISKFSSLSPIPNFKTWLFDKLKVVEKDKTESELFSADEMKALKSVLGKNVCGQLRKQLNSSAWLENLTLVDALKIPLTRLCAHYLYIEKRRGYALDNVANFHLRNGAVMWRINWLADLTPRGLTNSCGLMVNYRYFLEDTVINSIEYIEKKHISISPLIKQILNNT